MPKKYETTVSELNSQNCFDLRIKIKCKKNLLQFNAADVFQSFFQNKNGKVKSTS
jgi:hypothetical protein